MKRYEYTRFAYPTTRHVPKRTWNAVPVVQCIAVVTLILVIIGVY